jgi:hypothetical protein
MLGGQQSKALVIQYGCVNGAEAWSGHIQTFELTTSAQPSIKASTHNHG